jgi:hypothetical protein
LAANLSGKRRPQQGDLVIVVRIDPDLFGSILAAEPDMSTVQTNSVTLAAVPATLSRRPNKSHRAIARRPLL